MLVWSSLKEEGEVEMGLGAVDLINFNEGKQNALLVWFLCLI